MARQINNGRASHSHVLSAGLGARGAASTFRSRASARVLASVPSAADSSLHVCRFHAHRRARVCRFCMGGGFGPFFTQRTRVACWRLPRVSFRCCVLLCGWHNNSSKRTREKAARRLTPALDVRAAFLCSCVVSGTFQPFSGSARCVAFGRPALWSFVRWDVRRNLRAWAHLVSSCFVARAVRRKVACVVSGSFFRWQAISVSPLPGIQSSGIVLVYDGVGVCRLTRHSSGRLRRRLIPALGLSKKTHSSAS